MVSWEQPELDGMPHRAVVEVAGLPVTQGSKNCYRQGGRCVVVEVNEKELKPWRQAVAAAAQQVAGTVFFGEGVPVEAQITFRLPRPKSLPKRVLHPVAERSGDLDKLERAVYDALTGVLFKSDAQIVHHDVGKRFTDGPCGVTISLAEVME